MSTLSFSTLDPANGISKFYGQLFDITHFGELDGKLRPSGVTGMFGFNTEIGLV